MKEKICCCCSKVAVFAFQADDKTVYNLCHSDHLFVTRHGSSKKMVEVQLGKIGKRP